jgi:glycosyltransferase involved in cell wall biosynthesis
MTKKSILFVTSNTVWGGSEVLWTSAAKNFQDRGFAVYASAMYDHDSLKKIVGEDIFFDLKDRYEYPSLFIKFFQKIVFGEYTPKDRFVEWVMSKKPTLVVISQGNNVVGHSFMQLCNELEIPFVTVTHLVPERIWPTIDENVIRMLRPLYNSSLKNYFVSEQNLLLHEKIMGETVPNAEITYNPINAPADGDISYPPVERETYKIALVGRVEFFHKGQDLLLDIAKQEKWRGRNIVFSVFGDGPHLPLLKRLIDRYEIKNIVLRKHVEDISSVWKEHHMLLMPSRMEGQSLALTEAMYHKRAAIVTNVGGADKLIQEGESGFIADAATVKSIDDALERAWDRRMEWEQMGINAKKHISEKHPADPVQFFSQQLEKYL